MDAGATRFGLKESNIVLAVSKKLKRMLAKDSRFRVSMTRFKDRKKSLQDRANFAHKKGGQLFLSIHANASFSKRARGVEFYIQNQLPPSEEVLHFVAREHDSDSHSSSKIAKHPSSVSHQDSNVQFILHDLQRSHYVKKGSQLANSLVSSWKQFQKTKRKPIRQAPFFLVSSLNMPSVLVELGYISNPKEAKRINSSHFQEKMAKQLYTGLVSFIKTQSL